MQVTDIFSLLALLIEILNYIIPFLIAVAVVIFLVGVVKYISAAGDEEKRKSGRETMMWGIVGLFVMVAVWGLVNIIWNTFDLDTTAPPSPTFYPN